MKVKQAFFLCYWSLMAVLVCPPAAHASTDKYVSEYEQSLRPAAHTDPLSKLIALPFEIIRWPVSQTLLYVEKEHLAAKAEWIYDQFTGRGIYPSVGYMSGQGIQTGLKLDMPRFTKLDTQYPDLVWDAWTHYGYDIYFQTGTELGLRKIAGTPFSATGFAQYEDRWEEKFYGIGPNTSRGEGYSYTNEHTKVAGKIGYNFSEKLKSNFRMGFENAHISNSDDKKSGKFDRFPGELPGRSGDKVLFWDGGLKHDTRDHQDAPTKGGYRHLRFGYTEGVDDSRARYFSYQADLAQYIKVGSPRRIFAFRGLMEHHDEINNGNIPFYRMSKLGGYGTLPEQSRTLRSYGVNRFFGESLLLLNMEYRYAIWEYRKGMLDAVPFVDLGQVFGEWKDFQLKDTRASYGLEFRIYINRKNFMNFCVAHGDEGTNLFVRSKQAF